MRFIAFDVETTGTVPGVDQIVEIGAVRFNSEEIENVYATLVNPRIAIPPAASAVNKITNEMVMGKPFIEDLLESFSEFCGNDPMVAHNAPFDAQFFSAAFKKFDYPTPQGIILDTLPIARKIFPGLPNYKLGTLIQFLKIQTKTDFHRAEEDASYCGQMLLQMMKRISTNGQVPRIENLVALTGKPEFRFPLIEKKAKQLSFL